MTSNPVTPDGKWMLTELGWVCLEQNPTMTPDGSWKFEKGTFTELRRIENTYEENTVQVIDTLSTEEASKHPHLSIGDSVIMGDVKSDITVHQGPSLNKIKQVFRELLAEMGADTWNTPENISERQKKLLSESIESYDGIISTGGITDSSTELMVATAAKLSGDFKDAMSQLGMSHRMIPLEAPWQHGMVERHGDVMGEIVSAAVKDTSTHGLDHMNKIYKKASTLNGLISKVIGGDIITSYKRAYSILESELKNTDLELSNTTDPGIFKNDYEKNLFKKINEIRKYFTNIGKDENYRETLEILAGAKKATSEFFDNVKVNDDDKNIKKNRLELLQMLCRTFDNYINFSNIEIKQ